MKILLINFEFPPLGGGGGVFTRDLALELAKNHKVDVITTYFPNLKRTEQKGNLTIHRVSVLGRTSLSTATLISMFSFIPSAIIKGLKLFKTKNFDIINTHFAIPTGPVGMFLSFISGVPNILSIHGADIYDPSRKMSPHNNLILVWGVRFILNSATAIVAQSSNTSDNAKKLFRPKKDINIIPLGIPQPALKKISREELSLENIRKYAISVGRLIKRKSYDTLIKALAKVQKDIPLTSIILVGDGPEYTNLKNLSKELGLEKDVIFIRDADDVKKFALLLAADLYVLSSLHEGFGIVLLEAMFTDLPIVATNNGGQCDLLKNDLNAILVPIQDEDILAEGIIEMLKNPNKCNEIINNNRKKRQNFSISSVSEKYIKLFVNYTVLENEYY